MKYFFLNKFLNSFIRNGKKQKSENIIVNSLKKLKNTTRIPLNIFLKKIFYKSLVLVELKNSQNKRNKSKYPFYVNFTKAKRLSIKRIKKAILEQAKETLKGRLYNESRDIFNGIGSAINAKVKIINYCNEIFPILFKLKPKKNKKKRNINKY